MMAGNTNTLKTDSVLLKKTDTPCGFGAKGWTLIALEAVLMWISSGSVAHGLNVILPAIASTYHLDYARLLALATPASWTSVLSGYFGAKLCQRKGAKFLIVAGLLLGALSFGLMGNCGSLIGFAVLFSFVCIFDTTFAFIGGPAMLANWFPRKSTLAMGWATMGQSISTATYVPLVAILFGVFGVRAGFWGVPALMVVVAILFAFFVTEMPSNVPGSADAMLQRTEDVSKRLTTRQLLGMKDVWLMGLSFGCVFIMVVGLVSQMVPRLISLGVSQPVAIRALSLAALAGMPGAWAWGWLGQRYGVKKASIIYACWNACAILLNIVGSGSVLLWVSLFMIGFGLSGATNLSMSIVAAKFPGEQFVAAWSVINPIQSILRCCAFAIIAFGLTYLGGFTGAYMTLGVISLVAIVLISFINSEPFNA